MWFPFQILLGVVGVIMKVIIIFLYISFAHSCALQVFNSMQVAVFYVEFVKWYAAETI